MGSMVRWHGAQMHQNDREVLYPSKLYLNLRKKPYGFDGPELLQIFHERRPHLEQHMGKDKTPQVLMLYDLPKLCVKMDVP